MPPMLGQSNYGTLRVASHIWLLGLGCQAIVWYWGRGGTTVRRSWDWHNPPSTPSQQPPRSPAVSLGTDLIYHPEGGSAIVRSLGTAPPWPHLIEIQAQQTLHMGKWLLGTRHK